jgi:hypothetical protein
MKHFNERANMTNQEEFAKRTAQNDLTDTKPAHHDRDPASQARVPDEKVDKPEPPYCLIKLEEFTATPYAFEHIDVFVVDEEQLCIYKYRAKVTKWDIEYYNICHSRGSGHMYGATRESDGSHIGIYFITEKHALGRLRAICEGRINSARMTIEIMDIYESQTKAANSGAQVGG